MATALFTVKATITPDREPLDWLRQEYDRNFGGMSERQRAAYVQVWP